MKTKLSGAVQALSLAVAPFAATTAGVSGGNADSNWTIYGWQNWSWEHISVDKAKGDRDFSRINNNAANIGFSASLPTGFSYGR